MSITSPAEGATVGAKVPIAAEATDTGVMKRVEFLVNGSVVETDLTAPYAVEWNSASFANGASIQIAARAIDEANNQATSAARTVTVDNVAPETTLNPSGPSGTVDNGSARFVFSSETRAAFECKLTPQGGTPVEDADCSSPKDYQALTNGTYTFEVRARDAAGNTGPVKSRTWTVDVPPPDTKAPTLDTDRSDGSDGVTPDSGARNVKRNVSITATFSEAMDLESLRASGVFTLKNTKTGDSVQPAATNGITLSPDGRTATFDPAPLKLAKTTTYEVRITTGAKDGAGNGLGVDAVWSFTTGKK